jgi:hypothetical protein
MANWLEVILSKLPFDDKQQLLLLSLAASDGGPRFQAAHTNRWYFLHSKPRKDSTEDEALLSCLGLMLEASQGKSQRIWMPLNKH